MLTRVVILLFALVVAFAVLGVAGQPSIKKVPVSQTSANSGDEMFRTYCAACHGLDGKGGGPAVSALKNPPGDLTKLTAKNQGKFPELKVYSSIRGDNDNPAHGSKDMPVWGAIFQTMGKDGGAQAQLRISNLVAYIKGIQAK
jgi:mono/diheme cytochrome c family protein